ncbi:MAG: DNA-binding LytR/AlgR family response regulator [Shewanella psychromarinicola]|jgi:DNA-binding LytR/AlgR family response regulator|uniref:LytR/AlgR family response regulator transcription factor n=1 Tax=Shewanella psychromarinicola TaxID=2487742 RepID=UPI003EF04267
MYRVLLIDDEPAATQTLKRSLELFKHVQIVGCYNDPQQGIQAICQLSPDIVFMDIEMPIMDGFMVAKTTENIDYHLVFVTAYAEHAFSAFDTKVVDYLLKPVRHSRLARCMEKIERLSLESVSSTESEILIYDGKTKHRLTASDISYIECIGRYQQVNLTPDGMGRFHLNSIITEETMTEFEQQLDGTIFIRTHRGFIVNQTLIAQVEKGARNTLLKLFYVDKLIPVSRSRVTLINKCLNMPKKLSN